METIIEPKIELFSLKLGTVTNNYYVDGSDDLTGIDELNIIATMVQRIRERAVTEEQQEQANELLTMAFNGVNILLDKNGERKIIYGYQS